MQVGHLREQERQLDTVILAFRAPELLSARVTSEELQSAERKSTKPYSATRKATSRQEYEGRMNDVIYGMTNENRKREPVSMHG